MRQTKQLQNKEKQLVQLFGSMVSVLDLISWLTVCCEFNPY